MKRGAGYLLSGVLGLVVGALAVCVLAQRSSYLASVEHLARTAAELEIAARASLERGERSEAERQFAAALEVRKSLAKEPSETLVPPLNAPFTSFWDVVSSPSKPSLDVTAIYSGRGKLFLDQCALAMLSPEGEQSRQVESVVARFPNSRRENCAAVGGAYWSK